MRSWCDAARVWVVPRTSRTIRLEVDQSHGLLRGRVTEVESVDQEFEGWLGLLTVLGNVLDGPVSGDAPVSLRSTPESQEEVP
jgi:hypothetical protein